MRLLALTLLCAAASASAQPVLYRPLEIGSEWTYRYSTNATGSCVADTPRAFVRARVLRDTTSGGEAARVIRCDTYTANGVFTQSATAAAPVAFGSATTVSGTDNACRTIFSGVTPGTTTTIPNPVAIGPSAVLMGSVAASVFAFPRGATEDRYGDRVGRTSYSTSVSGSPGSPVGCSAALFSLAYAVIGGETFGANPVAGEAVSAAARALRAFPNPARSSVTVEGDGAVRVVDALGRVVASGTAAPGRALVLDVSGWPAGVYVARAGSEAVRLVVAR